MHQHVGEERLCRSLRYVIITIVITLLVLGTKDEPQLKKQMQVLCHITCTRVGIGTPHASAMHTSAHCA
jgi:hypothetical protein